MRHPIGLEARRRAAGAGKFRKVLVRRSQFKGGRHPRSVLAERVRAADFREFDKERRELLKSEPLKPLPVRKELPPA